jgi:putative membrane protein
LSSGAEGIAVPTFSWLGGEIHAEVVLGVVALAAAYTWATLRSRRPTPLGLPAAFFGGCVALLLAVNGPLHDLSDYYLFSAHMVQHLMLTLVVAPLWLAGTPGWMLDALVERASSLPAFATAVRWVTRPLPAFATFGVATVAWHLPGPYNAALEMHGWHVVEHLVLLATAVVGWWPILSRSARLPALPYAGQLLYLFVFGMPMTVVASMVAGAEEVLYPYYAAAPRLFDLTPLADQRLGGLIMWVPAGIIPVVAFTVVFFRWAAAEREVDTA